MGHKRPVDLVSASFIAIWSEADDEMVGNWQADWKMMNVHLLLYNEENAVIDRHGRSRKARETAHLVRLR